MIKMIKRFLWGLVKRNNNKVIPIDDIRCPKNRLVSLRAIKKLDGKEVIVDGVHLKMNLFPRRSCEKCEFDSVWRICSISKCTSGELGAWCLLYQRAYYQEEGYEK